MSKIKFIAKSFAVGLILLCFLSNLSYAGVINAESTTTVSKDQLKERLELLSTDVDLRYTSEIHSMINGYLSRYRKDSEVLLGRGSMFFPIYDQEFSKLGLPVELKYLSVIESSLRPTAVSGAGAVGLWQFIKSTGLMYGLTINTVVDERKDILRSTQAASQYLKALHEEFGDWTLALAAYNCGPGGVKKAQRYSNASSGDIFWEIKSYLPRETRRYVPKFAAVSYMMNYFDVHGLQPFLKDIAQEQYATTRVYEYTSFAELSKQVGLDQSILRALNPAFLKGYIPKSSKGYLLTLPESSMYHYLNVTNTWNDMVYRPSNSTTNVNEIYLYGSMRRKLVKLDALDQLETPFAKSIEVMSAEQSKGKSPIPSLPENPNFEDQSATGSNNLKVKYHKLQSQQSLMDIVNLFDITLEDLIASNDIDINNPPAPGTVIKIEMAE